MVFIHKAIHKYRLAVLLVLSTALRLILAGSVELGNDEVYYITYALYPDLSHFDHPPMVGWFIQLFTLNLWFDSEIWIRMGAVISGTLITLLMYYIGKEIHDETTGWYSALLYSVSIYGFVITGIFMMPDGPQVLFWMLALFLFIKAFNRTNLINYQKTKGTEIQSMTVSLPKSKKKAISDATIILLILLSGLSIGLSLLSKYTSIFILSGLFIWLLLNKQWLSKWYIWIAALIALLCFTPVIIWNVQNNFISFTFHSNRVEVTDSIIRPESFVTELAGQMLYNNPVIFALIFISIIGSLKGKLLRNNLISLLIWIGLPLILTFLIISFFRSTLPHWSGPAYLTLIPLAALWIRLKSPDGQRKSAFPKIILISSFYLIFIISGAFLQLNFNTFLDKGIDSKTGRRLGVKDITLDMYGWEQLNQQFRIIYKKDLSEGEVDKDIVILSHRWFPAANLDHYVAQPNGIPLITMAPLERTHKYAWITNYRGGFHIGMDAYFISSSYDYQDPAHLYSEYFTITQPDTIPIFRNNLLVKQYYLWKLKDMKQLPPKELQLSIK